jgi:flavin reductase (DIM6/NTAB) family NADH-FMN oxidoreductase RutF
MASRVRQAVKSLILGSENFPQQCAVGLRDPQSEISVWLHGMGAPRDVTQNNVMTAARPLTIGIGFERGPDLSETGKVPLVLQFRERDGEKRLLGSIGLRLKEMIPVGSEQLGLFETRTCANYCLPRGRLWARYAHYGYQNWRLRAKPGSNAPMVAREVHCVFAFYICPRPVFLVSACDGKSTNIFPMDLVGPVGLRHFSLALHRGSTAAPLLERSRRLALSSVPIEYSSVAYGLGKNHNKESVVRDEIPFETIAVADSGIPIPSFALRVREMEIEAVRTVGSHTVFLASTVSDLSLAQGLQFFVVHGFYQAWRSQRNGTRLNENAQV